MSHVRIKLARNGNQQDAKGCLLDVTAEDLGWTALWTLAANKLKMKKASRAFLRGGAELAVGSDALRRLANDTTLIVSPGDDYSGHVVPSSATTHSNTAGSGIYRVVASKTRVEDDAVTQLKRVSEWENVVVAVGLPDLHPGQGHPIGAAVAVKDMIYPALVGNDIGCGMALWRCPASLKVDVDVERWVAALQRANLDDALSLEEATPFLTVFGLTPPETHYRNSFGTVGGGNHFAELLVVERLVDVTANSCFDSSSVYLLVHSGSRGLGDEILDTHLRTYGSKGTLPGSPEGVEYIRRHDIAVKWGHANRAAIASRVMAALRVNPEELQVPLTDVCHNNVVPTPFFCRGGSSTAATPPGGSPPLWLHRKGAAPSNTKEPFVVIPGSRGAVSYVVRPRGEDGKKEESGYSLAHGAGRDMDRSTAARRGRKCREEDLTTTSLGSRVVCADHLLLAEEQPEAYKNIDSVVEDLVDKGLVDVMVVLRPLLTFKTMSTDKARKEGYELRK